MDKVALDWFILLEQPNTNSVAYNKHQTLDVENKRRAEERRDYGRNSGGEEVLRKWENPSGFGGRAWRVAV